MGVSVAIATILIVGAVIAIKRDRRPRQVRQAPNVPEPNVAPAQRAKDKTTDVANKTAMVSKSKVPNEVAMVSMNVVPNDAAVAV